MRLRTKLFFVVSFFLMYLISCKKDNATPGPVNPQNPDSVNTGSHDTVVTAKADLVAWYKFTGGNTADYSGNNNHLTPYNATPTTDYKGRPNNAYLFNGFSSYMETGNSNSLNPSKITLAALVKPEGYYSGTGASSRILMKGTDDQSSGVYFLGYNKTGSFYGTYGDNQYQSNGAGSPDNSLTLDSWYKLVYTYDGSVGKLYINDTLVNQTNTVATLLPMLIF